MKIIDRGEDWPMKERFCLGTLVDDGGEKVVYIQLHVGQVKHYHLEIIEDKIINTSEEYNNRNRIKRWIRIEAQE